MLPHRTTGTYSAPHTTPEERANVFFNPRNRAAFTRTLQQKRRYDSRMRYMLAAAQRGCNHHRVVWSFGFATDDTFNLSWFRRDIKRSMRVPFMRSSRSKHRGLFA